MNIKIKLKCHASTENPKYRIIINDVIFFDKQATSDYETIDFDVNLSNKEHLLIIEHYDKRDSDTLVDSNGNITADKAIEVESISIDNYAIPRNIIFSKKFYPIWPEHFETDQEFITNNTFLGFNGKYVFDFSVPFASTYYSYFWEMEKDANIKFQKVDADTKEEYFEAYGLKLKVDNNFSYTLTDLKKMIEDNEK